jgi:hypothetical protein
MSLTTDTNTLVIYALVFILGLLIGVFLTAGGRRKWKTRYNSEVDRRREVEKVHADREKEWREQDSLRSSADRSRDREVVRDRELDREREIERERARDRDLDDPRP